MGPDRGNELRDPALRVRVVRDPYHLDALRKWRRQPDEPCRNGLRGLSSTRGETLRDEVRRRGDFDHDGVLDPRSDLRSGRTGAIGDHVASARELAADCDRQTVVEAIR